MTVHQGHVGNAGIILSVLLAVPFGLYRVLAASQTLEEQHLRNFSMRLRGRWDAKMSLYEDHTEFRITRGLQTKIIPEYGVGDLQGCFLLRFGKSEGILAN